MPAAHSVPRGPLSRTSITRASPSGNSLTDTRIISTITALPAFFVDVPAWLKVVVGLFVLLTVAVVAMLLTPAHRQLPVTD